MNLVIGDKSSIKVSVGCCATLFRDLNFKGKSRTFCKSSSYVGQDFNDKAFSMKIKQGKKFVNILTM